ncbi:hypothetical protein FOZ62_002398 [Perkinsus olseni]|uniref:C3H1-type domain-containing protein n=1 Tax=Perkinsus olseni TaxID=32597 RepID=A0A7J6Q5U5_PEROL|nr:hypothetical protein FOZ62_002398 [Perkinsus olseni]
MCLISALSSSNKGPSGPEALLIVCEMPPPCRYHEAGERCPQGLRCNYYHNPRRGAALIRCQFYDHGHCRFGLSCQFLHSDKKPVCHFFSRGQCRNGAACPFSHDGPSGTEASVCHFFLKGECRNGESCRFLHQQSDDQQTRSRYNETIDSPKKLAMFLERLSLHKGDKFCLDALLEQKGSLRNFIRDLGVCELAKLFALLGRCGEVEKQKYEQLIGALSTSLIIGAPRYIESISGEAQLLACTKVLVDAARLNRIFARQVPVIRLVKKSRDLEVKNETLEGLLMRLKIHKNSCRLSRVLGTPQKGG